MDSGTVKTFTDAAAQLLPALVQFASIPNDQRTPEDEAMIRQLRVARAESGDRYSDRGPSRQLASTGRELLNGRGPSGEVYAAVPPGPRRRNPCGTSSDNSAA